MKEIKKGMGERQKKDKKRKVFFYFDAIKYFFEKLDKFFL